MEKLLVGIESAVWYDPGRPEDSIRLIKECGFESIDFDFDKMFSETFDKEGLTSFYDMSLEELLDYYKPLKAAAEEYGITFGQSHGICIMHYHYTENHDAINDYILKITEKHIAACAYLGCRAIVIHPWTGTEVHKDEERSVNLDMYRRLIPAAKKYRVKICLENLFAMQEMQCIEGSCSNADEACWYIDTLNAEAGKDVFGFCFDVGHAVLTGADLYQYIVTLGKRLTILHIHDNGGSSDAHMIPFTQLDRRGKRLQIDWEMFIKGLKESGYEGPISFETFRGLGFVPPELQKDGLKFISAIGRYLIHRLQS